MQKECIISGKACLGLELGSTRIKAVLIDEKGNVLASGGYEWENSYKNGYWTYELNEAIKGINACYMSLKRDVSDKYGVKLTKIASIGISAMMHGYIVFDKNEKQLADFRTWRNMASVEAVNELCDTLKFNIPRRWSSALFYQAVLDKEEHVNNIYRLMTLSCYIHTLLTDNFVIGVCDASGIFPIDPATSDYDEQMIAAFDMLLQKKGVNISFKNLLPKVLLAGESGGTLTEKGALILDSEGDLESGVMLCPPEGDGGTGMVATNSVAVGTGNISAGTSAFAMTVFEGKLSNPRREIDVLASPDGSTVAMIHASNCTSELNAWADAFAELSAMFGNKIDRGQILSAMFDAAQFSAPDCGGVINCNFLSGDNITGFSEGRPLTVRTPESEFNIGTFSRALIFSAIAPLKIGMEYLKNENVSPSCIMGHGGYFKSSFGQKAVAAAFNTPVSVLKTAGEGGAWGIALLAGFARYKSYNERLSEYLDKNIFSYFEKTTVQPDENDVTGFNEYIKRYKTMLNIERTAVDVL